MQKSEPKPKQRAPTKDIILRGCKYPRAKKISDEAHMRKATHLHLSEKKIATLEGARFDLCPKLMTLYLHGNQLRSLDGLPSLPNLTSLYLQGNQLTEISGLEVCQQLSKLYLTNNCLSNLGGLAKCQSLVELDISDQRLDEGVSMQIPAEAVAALSETLVRLTVSNSGLTALAPLAGLKSLEFLDASANQLTDVKDACAFCGSVPELMELNLKGERARRAARPRASCAALTHPPPACARNRESYHEDPQVQGQYYRYVVDKYAKTRLRAHKLRTADQPSRAADMLDGKPVREQERDFLVAMQAKRRKRGKKSASGKGSARSGPSFQISAVDRQ